MRAIVASVYEIYADNEIEIPDIESWDQIKSWFIKWGTFFYTINGSDYKEIELDFDIVECADLKRPTKTKIYTNVEVNGVAKVVKLADRTG